MTFLNSFRLMMFDFMKRFFDFAVAISAIIVCAPVMIFIALLICLLIGRPVLFRQKRPGLNGKPFILLKFRTMTEDRDEHGNLLPDVKRLTRHGQFLRSTSLDELPELFNVLKGEMSLVGPRPFMPQQRELHANTYHRYIRIRPGLTGMWQVYGRSELQYDFRIQMDEYYFRNWSIWLDLYIMIRTPWVVIRKVGAY